MFASAFELFRIGPGPSSSYTVGPQQAALRFVHDLSAEGLLPLTARVEAELYGGLAFAHREHGSDRAIVAGLCGQRPERCNATDLDHHLARARAERSLPLGGGPRVQFDPNHDLRHVVNRTLAYDGNAVRFVARSPRGDVIASRVYFPQASGSVLSDTDAATPAPQRRVPYPFGSADSLLAACRTQGKKIADLVRANECAYHSPGEVRAGILAIAEAMRAAVERGLNADGLLPGGGRRTASAWADASRAMDAGAEVRASVYATAVAEENAAGGRVVAAPSSGSAGPVAALLQLWRESAPLAHEERTQDFLLTGAAAGSVLRGAGAANVGCQGEVGVAAAMAAAGFACVLGGSNVQILFAAERALAPHLGLACDPPAGRIEQPCIERNAHAATRAYEAAMAAVRIPAPRLGLDVLARSLVESGRGMAARAKTASIGGIAVNVAEC